MATYSLEDAAEAWGQITFVKMVGDNSAQHHIQHILKTSAFKNEFSAMLGSGDPDLLLK